MKIYEYKGKHYSEEDTSLYDRIMVEIYMICIGN